MDYLVAKRKRIAQSRARLNHAEILLKVKERKLRISNFIRIGEIMEKCNISKVDHKILAGAFLFINESLKNPKQASEWATKGEPYVIKSLLPKRDLIPLRIVFPKVPSEEIRKQLWSYGFTCETTDHIWEGRGIKKEIASLVIPYGTVYKIKTIKVA